MTTDQISVHVNTHSSSLGVDHLSPSVLDPLGQFVQSLGVKLYRWSSLGVKNLAISHNFNSCALMLTI